MNTTEFHPSPAISRTCSVTVLVADEDVHVAKTILEVLAPRRIFAHVVEDWRSVLNFVDRNTCDLAFVGLRLIGQGAALDRERLRQLRVNQPELPIIVMAGPGETGTTESSAILRSIAHLVQTATEAGCNQVLIKPLMTGDVEQAVAAFTANGRVACAAAAEQAGVSLYQIIGRSQRLAQVLGMAERIAPTSAPVLIAGESGTGKELICSLIHHKSKRAQGPYVRVNCSALSDSLLESELFGHEKGAFTGAHSQRKGRFEMAHGGTLLLDEITETPPRFQAKLLRILEQQEFERVGGSQPIKVNVRILSTTNRNLMEEVQAGRFREDLYYRLSATRLVIPPLRQRRQDLPDLVWHFVSLHARESGRRIEALDPMMMDLFARYPWPGNVRQLRNMVRTALILGSGSSLSLSEVSWLMDEESGPCVSSRVQDHAAVMHERAEEAAEVDDSRVGLGGLPLEQIERRAILETLEKTSGNRKKAAESLGISDRTLREKIRRYREQELIPSA